MQEESGCDVDCVTGVSGGTVHSVGTGVSGGTVH